MWESKIPVATYEMEVAPDEGALEGVLWLGGILGILEDGAMVRLAVLLESTIFLARHTPGHLCSSDGIAQNVL